MKVSSQQKFSMKWSKAFAAYILLMPAVGALLIFRIYPIYSTFVESLYSVDYKQGTAKVFSGLENYWLLLTDPFFWESLEVTLYFNLLINPIQIALSLAVSLLIYRNTPTNQIFRTFYLLPLGVSVVVASVIWGILLNPNQGLINSFLALFGLPKQPFLTSPTQALWSIILVATWCGIPFWMLFLLAGLQEIPEEYYEAARIDGANSRQMFWHITLPSLRRVLIFVTIADTSANFLLFAPMFVLTRGGPEMSTNTLMYETYSSAFVYSDFPRAFTLSSILLIILFILVKVEFKLFGKER